MNEKEKCSLFDPENTLEEFLNIYSKKTEEERRRIFAYLASTTLLKMVVVILQHEKNDQLRKEFYEVIEKHGITIEELKTKLDVKLTEIIGSN